MALKITDDCINCGACEPECPNQAIYEAGTEWSMSEGTKLKGVLTLFDGREVEADEMQDALSDEFYFIVTDKCTECKGFHEEEQCIDNCPVPECLIVDPEQIEDEVTLLEKQARIHA